MFNQYYRGNVLHKATCHKDGVFVSGKSNKAYPLSHALERWKQDFTDTKSGRVKASVEFRFSKRLGDKTTAHETGMFFYSRVNADGTKTMYYIHLEALLIKRGTWKTMMEYQKSEGVEKELKEIERRLEQKYNFQIVEHRLDVTGYCSECEKDV